MPKVRNVEKKIWDVEEFEVKINKDGKDVRGDKTVPNQYEYKNKSKGSQTVSEWKRKRFDKMLAGYEVDVLFSDGKIAKGNTTLVKVRDSYIDEED